MPAVDLKKSLKHLYAPSAKEVVFVDVPAMRFLLLDGVGDPNGSPHFPAAVEALFALSYALKFAVRAAQGVDYGVMPLEGLWWMADGSAFDVQARERWAYTVMIMQPDCVTAALVETTRAQVQAKKGLPELVDVRFASYEEGRSAQILHIGPFSAEGPTVARLHQAIGDAGAAPAGKHHEIYLSDIRRADPSRWKTILRQPIG